MPRVSNAICRMLNLTPEYIRVRDVKGGKQADGSWTGDFNDISTGFIDGSIWGYIPTLDRLEVSTFVQPITENIFGFLIRRPRVDDVSLMNYVAQLKPIGWQVFFACNILFWCLFGLLLYYNKVKRTAYCTIVTMLRTLLNKVEKPIFQQT